ncbi:hypothetical protein LDENG_00045650 [Lucifuga dentata]|nr:hypothetical protein LDENG_00045650 [Lucifuga dentata]
MRVPMALLFASVLILAPECAAKGDSMRNTINSIVNIAKITLVHIRKIKAKVPFAPQIDVSVPSIEGLTSISRDLALLENELLLLPFSDLLSQIKADVSSLGGRLHSLALTVPCPVPARPTAQTPDHVFPHTHLHLTLTKLQHYLEKFPPNKDKLQVC